MSKIWQKRLYANPLFGSETLLSPDDIDGSSVIIDGQDRVMKIPIINNVYTRNMCSLQTVVKSRPRSKQKAIVGIVNPGNLTSSKKYGDSGWIVDQPNAATVAWKPKYLFNVDGTSQIVDDLNYLGKCGEKVCTYTQMLTAVQTGEITSPKIVKLPYFDSGYPERWKILAALFSVKIDGTDRIVSSWFLKEMDIEHTSDYYDYSYEWDNFSEEVEYSELTVASDASSVASVDAVQLKDGSVVLALAYKNGGGYDITFCKSFARDFSAGTPVFQWNVTYQVSLNSNNGPYDIGIETIGNRISVVAVTSDAALGGSNQFSVFYSDDAGHSWNFNDDSSSVNYDRVDLVASQNGKIYAFVAKNGGAWGIYESTDGIDYNLGSAIHTDAVPTVGGITAIQEYFGRWIAYRLENATPNVIKSIRDTVEGVEPSATWSSGTQVLYEGDSDGLETTWISARELFDGGFIDMAHVIKDTHAPVDYYRIAITRYRMWSSYQYENVPPVITWFALAYPSTSDSAPNQNIWTRGQAGTGAALIQNTEKGYVRMTAVDKTADQINYYMNLPFSNARTDGITILCELKVYDGVGTADDLTHFRIVASDGANQVNVSVRFYPDKIEIYDNVATSVVDTFTPTNWDLEDYNTFLISLKGTAIYIYRSPCDLYNEFQHYEACASETSLGTTAGANDQVFWGYEGSPTEGRSHWRKVFIWDGIYTGSLSMSTANSMADGGNLHYNPVGIMQGFGVKANGLYTAESDSWIIETTSNFAPENIFIPSPSIKWREPMDGSTTSPYESAVAPQQIFEFRPKYSTDDLINYNAMVFGSVHSVCFIGRNWAKFKYEVMDEDGSNATTKFDTSSAEHSYLVESYAVTVDKNMVTISTINGMYYDQIASNKNQTYYLAVTSGTLSGHVFKIIRTTDGRFYLNANVEALGFAYQDTCAIFTSSFLFLMGETTKPRHKLTIYSQRRPVGDTGLELGTMLIGTDYQLTETDWNYSVEYRAENKSIISPSGRQYVQNLGGIKRIFNMAYSGQLDSEIGQNRVVALFNMICGSVYPVVFLDSYYSRTNPAVSRIGYHFPILASVKDSINLNHMAYFYESADGLFQDYEYSNLIRNIHDVTGFRLEELI